MASNVLGENKTVTSPSPHKRIQKLQQLPNVPKPFGIKDWKETALAFDRFVFDYHLEGEYLPPIWKDRTHYNMDEDTFGLMSYVGKSDQGGDGSQEAVNVMGAVLGATLAGIDKSDQGGQNYVRMLQTFYRKDEKVFVWYPHVPSGDTFWYEIQAHVLYYALSSFYPNQTEMTGIMRESADRWVEAVEAMKDPKTGLPDFWYTSFDFKAMEPVDNTRWKEPDSASGIAMLLYMAYCRFGDEKYLKTAETCMDFLERQRDNPYYELLMYYGPYLAARMAAEHGKDYDIDKYLGWIFDGGTAVRPAWGMCSERWGHYDMHGLIGTLADFGGYVFAMNGFHLFSTLAPLLRYDPRYARDIGKWMLNIANNSKFFYADGLPAENQSCPDWDKDPGRVIPYEGIRKEYEGKSPYASGDPTVAGWGPLDFSIYSGGHVGFMGGLIEKTNVEGILKIDCLKTDYYHKEAYPTYLFFNPYGSAEEVEVTGLGSRPVDLYDTVSGRFVARAAVERASFRLESNAAAILVLVPAGGKPEKPGGQLWIDGVFVAPAPKPAVNILGLQYKQQVDNVLKLKIEAEAPDGETIEEIRVTFGRTVLFHGRKLPEPFFLDTLKFHNGLMKLKAVVRSSGGATDSVEVAVVVNNPKNTLSDPN